MHTRRRRVPFCSALLNLITVLSLLLTQVLPLGGLTITHAANHDAPLAQATPTPTPSSSLNCASELLDNFNRADGGLGANWQGHLGQYSIVSNQVGTNSPCCEVTWVNGFGASQDACLTLSVMDTTASEVGVVLKVQNGFTYWGGLKVVYVPGTGVQVWTREPTEGWVQQGSTLAATFASGDVLGARAKSNGTVEVYKNGSLIGTRDVSSWSLYASSGQIGFTVNGGTTTKLDNFGGGTYTGLLPSQSDSAFRTVAYSSPRASEANTPAIVVTPPANQTWRSYYYLGGKRIAMRTRYGNGNPDVVNYLHGDHLGSTSLTTSSTGAVVSSSKYYPYGADRAGGTGTPPTDYKFTGQRQDANIGLYDYGARFYDPLLGRFLSADTIVPGAGNPQALNRFSYTFNNPLKYIDPSGYAAYDEYVGRRAPDQQVIDIFLEPEPSQEDLMHALFNYYATHPDYDPSQDQALAYDQQAYAASVHATWQLDRAVRSGQSPDIAAYTAGMTALVLANATSGGISGVVAPQGIGADPWEAGSLTGHGGAQEVTTARGGTYLLRDTATGEVQYVGRTNDLARRQTEYARDPIKWRLEFEVDRRSNDYAVQRGREQMLYEQYQPPLNKIRPISPRNPHLWEYLEAARRFEEMMR